MTPARASPSSSSSSSMPSRSSSNFNQGAYRLAPRGDGGDFDPEVESDIVDQYSSVLEHSSDLRSQAPPRPESRLDFHTNALADAQDAVDTEQEFPSVSNVPPRSSRLEWTKSLFQKIGFRSSPPAGSSVVDGGFINEEPPTTSLLPAPARTTISSTFSYDTAADGVGVMIDDISFAFCSSDEETDSSDGDSEIDVDVLDDLEVQVPDSDSLPSPITVSEDFSSFSSSPSSSSSTEPIIFAPRASRASSSLEDADMDLLVKPKYSCLPSLLSPHPRSPRSPVVSPQPQRHAYEHHGQSRHSLMHTKWFWAMREEEWAEYAVCVQHIPAYGGIEPIHEIPLAERFPSLFASARDTPPPSTQASPPSSPPSSPPMPPLPPLSIHPRWGDLSGLRDSWCTHMDRYFVGIPLWRIRKSLWTADMEVLAMVHLRTKTEEAEDETYQEPDSCATSSCGESMQMSMLTGYSDDSDLTLVDSDNEEEAAASIPESSSSSAGAGKACAAFDSEGDEGHFEDVDLNSHGPTASASSSSSSASFSVSSSTLSFAHATPKPFALEGHSKSTSPLQIPFCPPYSPQCPYSLKQLGYPWATCWYQQSQLLLQLWGLGQTTTTTAKSQGKAPMPVVGLGLGVIGPEKERHSHNDSGLWCRQ
ncbi:hypothetical protein Moror_7205 [Moniliophthora roreri MCA 2997]|uniref:Uncharacterized protein n=1 Tax=Moniliophthora roreri (strain MCA 2997) TaxID=1381753 RepID=V2XUL7_MONRO|nr:hypothetical protein Moror_7205 [Moniliophthora roreri MCA 2997]